MSATPFVETEAILALLNDDAQGCEELLREMLPHELARLIEVSSELTQMAKSMGRIKARATQVGGGE